MPDPMVLSRVMAAAAVIAAVVVLVCGWPWRSPRSGRTAAGWVLGVAAAVYAGCVLFDTRLRWPPLEALPRFLMILLPATVLVELAAAPEAIPRWLIALLRVLLAAAAPWVLLHGSKFLRDLSAAEAAQKLALFSAALAAVWYLLGTLQRRSTTPAVPLALAGTCLGAGVTIMYSGDLTDGQVGLPLGAALAGASVASLLLRAKDRTRGFLGVGLVSLFSLLVMGHFFGQLTTTHALLLFFAPLLCWLPALAGPRRMPAWGRGAVQIVLVALAVGLVLYQAQQRFAQESQTSPGTIDYEDAYR